MVDISEHTMLQTSRKRKREREKERERKEREKKPTLAQVQLLCVIPSLSGS